MSDYNKWTKEDLIQRVQQLEEEIKNSPYSAVQSFGEPTTATTTTITDAVPDQPATNRPRTPRGMDPSKYATRFTALKLAYLGSRYNGFEYQCSGAQSTIEEELWKALVKTCLIFPNPDKPNEVDWNVCGYSKCGRTDRGVSAFGQVVALRLRSNRLARRKDAAPTTPSQDGKDVPIEATETAEEVDDADDAPLPVEQEIQYCRVLNRILPPDIRVYAWCPHPPPDFSARFSCRERQYRYFFTQPAFAPLPNFLERPAQGAAAATRPKDGWLDIAAMRKAAKAFEGLHDFRNFCKVDPSKQITNFRRRIFEADIVEVAGIDSALPYLASPQFRDPAAAAAGAAAGAAAPPPRVFCFHVRGSAFLWHQVRCMAAVLFLVGQGHERPGVVARLLDAAAHPRRPSYMLADDAPLVLWECLFGRRGAAGANEAAGAAAPDADALDWVYLGGRGDSPLSLHGRGGLAGELWAGWRAKKMDEILANRLLDWVSRKTGMATAAGAAAAAGPARPRGRAAAHVPVFEGGNAARLAGAWVPLMEKECGNSPEELNDRYAVRKGFKNAAAMRALGNWRDAIREAKEREAATGSAEG